MSLKIEIPPRSIENKLKSYHDLRHFFGVASVEELVLALRELRHNRLADFDVLISKDYLKWEEARRTLQLRSDIMRPVNPFGILNTVSAYGVGSLFSKIKDKQSLTEGEIIEVIRKLPYDVAERYLQFRLKQIDWGNLSNYAVDNPLRHRRKEAISFLPPAKYHGLEYKDSQIFYLGDLVKMRRQLRLILRVLIDKEGKVCRPNDFFNPHAEIFSRLNNSNAENNLRIYISEAHTALKDATGNKEFIQNDYEDGWKLVI